MKITISKIPGDFPATYSEQLYFDGRAVKDINDLFTVETAKKVQIYGDTSYRKRKIQRRKLSVHSNDSTSYLG